MPEELSSFSCSTHSAPDIAKNAKESTSKSYPNWPQNARWILERWIPYRLCPFGGPAPPWIPIAIEKDAGKGAIWCWIWARISWFLTSFHASWFMRSLFPESTPPLMHASHSLDTSSLMTCHDEREGQVAGRPLFALPTFDFPISSSPRYGVMMRIVKKKDQTLQQSVWYYRRERLLLLLASSICSCLFLFGSVPSNKAKKVVWYRSWSFFSHSFTLNAPPYLASL